MTRLLSWSGRLPDAPQQDTEKKVSTPVHSPAASVEQATVTPLYSAVY